jgi:hypothetical protein
MNRSTFSLTAVAVFIIVIPLARSAFGCYATWAWDTRPNVYATEADLQQCVASGAAWNDGGTYHVRDLHKQAGYDAIYVIGSAAPGAENLGTFARRAIGSYYVLVEVQRPAKTQIEYRDRTVTVPVERVVERQVAVATPQPLPPLVAEPSPTNLWNGQQPYALISDAVITQLRGTGVVVSKGAGNDEIITVPCPVDAEATRRIAYYAHATAQFSGAAESLNPYWVLISVTTPPTVEVRDREVQVPVDRPVPEPNPTRVFLENNMTKTVVLLLVIFLTILVVVLSGARGLRTRSLCDEVERRFLSGRYR